MKKPTIKAFNRAYVRLWEMAHSLGQWDALLHSHTVRLIPPPTSRSPNCGAVVVDHHGRDACLGMDVPFKITYLDFVEPSVQTFTEHYSDGVQLRTRIVDILGRVRSDEMTAL